MSLLRFRVVGWVLFWNGFVLCREAKKEWGGFMVVVGWVSGVWCVSGDYKGYGSVPPGLAAGIAAHEAGHGFIGCPDLLHVLAESVFLVAEAALLARVLVDILLHFVVEARPALLQLGQLVLPDVLSHLLVKVQLLVVAGQLFGGDSAAQHLFLGLPRVFARQAVADGVDALVQGLF